jgi:N-methylhydantoinase A
MDVEEARAILAAQVEDGRRLLATEGVEVETVTVLHQADMQFAGQTHVLTVTIPRTDFTREDLVAGFEHAYWERFEVELKQMRALVMSLRTAVIGRRPPVSLNGLATPPARGTAAEAQAGTRRGWFEGAWHETPIYRREKLAVGVTFEGPAIVEQLDSTTVVEAGDRVEVDALGNLIISVRGAV